MNFKCWGENWAFKYVAGWKSFIQILYSRNYINNNISEGSKEVHHVPYLLKFSQIMFILCVFSSCLLKKLEGNDEPFYPFQWAHFYIQLVGCLYLVLESHRYTLKDLQDSLIMIFFYWKVILCCWMITLIIQYEE